MQDELAIPDEAVKAPVRAAQYVRMSTDQQKYSTQNQAEAIAAFAAGRGLTVVRTYADEGRSGLDIDRREALQNLIDDVRTGRADFKFILVYDVSRWGRFQDADKSAYYEFICKEAGLQVLTVPSNSKMTAVLRLRFSRTSNVRWRASTAENFRSRCSSANPASPRWGSGAVARPVTASGAN
jgi:predicted site-specific integrase-resolvase